MPDIHHQITIQAAADKVFAALSTEAGLQSWWTDDTQATPEVGSIAVFSFLGGTVQFHMKVTALEASKRVVWQCVDGPKEWIGTLLTWDLAPDADGATIVRFAHTDWHSVEGDYPRCNTTWGHLMYYLKDYVEGKKPGAFFVTS